MPFSMAMLNNQRVPSQKQAAVNGVDFHPGLTLLLEANSRRKKQLGLEFAIH